MPEVESELSARVAALEALVGLLEFGSCDGCGSHVFCPLCVDFDEWSEAQQVFLWARVNCRNKFLAAKVVQHGEDCAADREPSCDPPPGPCNCRLSA